MCQDLAPTRRLIREEVLQPPDIYNEFRGGDSESQANVRTTTG